MFFLPAALLGQDYDKFIGGGYKTDKTTSATDPDTLESQPDTLKISQSLSNMLNSILDESEETTEQEIGLEINGLIVDQTRTKAGKDFYDHFFRNWEAPKTSVDYSIVIKEKPFRIRTTQILISINDNEIFKQMLQPRRDYIEMLAEYAIARCNQFLLNYEDIIRQLGGDDQMGSGIY